MLQLGGRIITKDTTPQIKIVGDIVQFHLRERPKIHRLAPEEQDGWLRRKVCWGGSGIFDLSISTNAELGFQLEWHDGRKGQLEDRLQQILRDMVDKIQDGRRWRLGAPARELERQRKLQEERQRESDLYRLQEERRLEAERVEFLVVLAERHTKAMQLPSFLAACRQTLERSAADERLARVGRTRSRPSRSVDGRHRPHPSDAQVLRISSVRRVRRGAHAMRCELTAAMSRAGVGTIGGDDSTHRRSSGHARQPHSRGAIDLRPTLPTRAPRPRATGSFQAPRATARARAPSSSPHRRCPRCCSDSMSNSSPGGLGRASHWPPSST